MERRMRLSHNLEASPTEYSLIVQGRESGEKASPTTDGPFHGSPAQHGAVPSGSTTWVTF